MTALICLGIAGIAGLVSFAIEKSESIHFHIDRHHDAFLAALTGGTTALFVSLILKMVI